MTTSELIELLKIFDGDDILGAVEQIVKKHGPRLIGWLKAVEKSGALRALAKLNARYYRDLISAGFTSAQAFELLKSFGTRSMNAGGK